MDNNRLIVWMMNKSPELGLKMLMKYYEQPLYWYIRRIVISEEDTKDVLQETFIRVFRFWNNFDEQKSLKNWLYQIATNEALRHLKLNRNGIMVSLDNVPEGYSLMDDNYKETEDSIELKLQKAIHTLPEKQQLAFNLRYYDELSYEAIEEITGISASSMKANYHIAKNRIMEYMNNSD